MLKIALVLGALVVLVIAIPTIYKFYYPFGTRTCFLPCMLAALERYARDHDNNYPDGTNSYDALLKLHPEYLAGATEMLAGISGDREGILEKVDAGKPFDGEDCSWVYFPGLRCTDDSQIALLYERTSGVAFNGMRRRGRAVGFVGNHHTQVPDEEWGRFLIDQAKLRAQALSERGIERK